MKFIKLILPIASVIILSSCLGTEENQYDAWCSENIQWMAQEESRTNPDGTPYYERIQAPWDFQGYVLMKWHNDRKATEKNLSPMSNSTIDMKYHGRLITGEAFDSSYLRTQPRDSIFRTKLNNTINGWIIGVSQMHIGDSCTIVIPYLQGYGASGSGSGIKPYSNLIFDVKLVDIPGYEKPVAY